MNTAPQSNSRVHSFFDLLMLYFSKSGAIVVGLFALPWYQQLLGPAAFGVAALVLSIQAFLLLIDLGTSVLVGRDLASVDSTYSAITTLRAAQIVLHIFYALLFIAVVMIGALEVTNATMVQLVASTVFFWALAVQNVGQSALLACKHYRVAGAVQAGGVLARAAITLSALIFVRADLSMFLVTQATTAAVQMLGTAWICNFLLPKNSTNLNFRSLLLVAGNIAHRGKPLVLFGLAGAAVLQLDKVIVSFFMTPAELAPYFLASVLCLTPISVLAGPITQYFQPRIFKSISLGIAKDAEQQLRLLTTALACAVAIPSVLLWLGRDIVVHLWLPGQSNAADVTRYVAILLPGVAVGSLGYIPYTILTAYQDFKVQASMLAALTVLTLSAAAFFASAGDLVGVCVVYALYHVFCALASWIRAIQLQPRPPHHYATLTAIQALFILAPVLIVSLLLAKA